jgi:hypothetical protein
MLKLCSTTRTAPLAPVTGARLTMPPSTRALAHVPLLHAGRAPEHSSATTQLPALQVAGALPMHVV